MAYKKSYTIEEYGITLPEAYHRVDLMLYNKNEKRFSFNVFIYKDETARNEQKKAVQQQDYNVVGDEFDEYVSVQVLNEEGINMITQAYTWLKDKVEYYNDAENI